MKAQESCIALVLSLIAIVFSIIALCFAAYRTPDLGFDYTGAVVGVLAILVTTLIGWQIYSLVDIRKIQDNLNNIKKESIFNAEKNNTITCHAVSDVFYALMLGETPCSFEQQYVYYRISEIFHSSNMQDYETCDVVIRVLLEVVVAPEKIKVTKSAKKDMISLLSQIQEPLKIKKYTELMVLVSRLYDEDNN